MKAWEIIGYTGDADAYCLRCLPPLWEIEDARGGSEDIHPIFAVGEGALETVCGMCHETLESTL